MGLQIGIAGWSSLPPAPEITGSLDELIYRATSSALDHAEMGIDEIDGVSMASSDLNDGRAISTMTLTGSTGSFRKSELRVCNDGLAAIIVAAAEIGSGSAGSQIVCAWNKFSDVIDPAAIVPLALEPTMHRALHYHPGAILALRRSASEGRPVIMDGSPAKTPMDTAGAIVVTRSDHPKSGDLSLTGFGASTGPYLRPGEAVTAPVARAIAAAIKSANLEVKQVSRVVVGGLAGVDSKEIAEAAGIEPAVFAMRNRDAADLGYATGLIALVDALESGGSGPTLIVSGSGLGMESAYAVILERK